MKRMTAFLLCLVCLMCLAACGSKEPAVEYYISRRQLEHSTGDVNLSVTEYDDQWRMLSVDTYLNGEISSRLDYSYSEDESLVTVKSSSRLYGESIAEYRQKFDAEGRLSKSVAYNDGELVGSTEYSYDAEGRERELVSRDPNGEVYSRLIYEYDKKGNLISQSVETPAYTSKQEHSYDKAGQLISTKSYRNGSLESCAEYTWEDNVRHGSSYDAEGKLIGTNLAVYDEFGNILVEDSFDILGTLQLHSQYEYIGTDGSISSGIN
ncbi:MAG: hypothetical protein IJE09_05605 [Oscillospiraceae bacterium]|nr:hypothetical protein [Oscillospiraceae bacterium]